VNRVVDLSVREALTIGPLERARVLAGKQGLGRTIKTVTIMDTPDIANWLKGGELLLTNVYVIKDDPAAQVALVRDLYDRGVAALGVKLKRFVQELPQEMLALANELGLPIIEMPVDVAWIEVLNPVLTDILNRQAARLEESGRIHDHFTRVALLGQGMPAICSSLTELTGSPCAVFDKAKGLVAQAPEKPGAVTEDTLDFEAAFGAVLSQAPPGTTLGYTAEFGGRQISVSLLAAGAETYGYFLVALDQRTHRTMALTALQHASTVATLEMVKARAVLETERLFRNDFLLDLLSGSIESRDVILARARSLGNWDFRRPHMIMVADLDRFEDYYLRQTDLDEGKIQRLKSDFQEVVAMAARAMNPGAICLGKSDSVTVLLPVDGEFEVLRRREQVKSFAAAVKAQVGVHLREVTVSVGIGRCHPDVLEWPQAHRQARLALEYGRRIWGRNQIIHYDELGTYRLLLDHGNMDDLRSFAEEMLSKLDASEDARREGLYRTLEQFFRCNRSIRETAEALFVHVNTVRHRLGRIRSLMGFDPENAEDCLNLEMALRIRTCLKNEDRGYAGVGRTLPPSLAEQVQKGQNVDFRGS